MAAAARLRFWACGWLWAWIRLLGLGLRARAAAQGHVPVLAWSTDSSVFPPPALAPPAGGVLGEGQLLELLSPALSKGPPTRILFIMDQLSLEDFTLYGNRPDSAFPNLQGALRGAGSSLVLGAVPPGALPHTLGSMGLGGSAPRRGGPELLRGLNGSGPGLLLLHLPHGAGSGLMTQREALAKNDALLGEVLGALRDQGLPHSALLSAHSPSHLHPPLRWPRPPAPPQLLLWARNISLERGGQRLDLSTRTFGGGADVTLGGSWDPNEATLELKYDDVFGEKLQISFRFRRRWFPVSGRHWWWLAELGAALGDSTGAVFTGGAAGAPSPRGWSCAELEAPGPFLRATGDPPALRVALRELQVQPFEVRGPFFGGASSCSAFFSGPAWMGVLSGGLLLGALLGGAALALRLRPMDRFDDPRGPPLPVPASE